MLFVFGARLSMARQRPAGCAPLLILLLSLFFEPAPAGASSLLRAAGEVWGSKSLGYQKQEGGWGAMQRRMGLRNGVSGGGRLVCHPRAEWGGALLTRGAPLPKTLPNPSQIRRALPQTFPKPSQNLPQTPPKQENNKHPKTCPKPWEH